MAMGDKKINCKNPNGGRGVVLRVVWGGGRKCNTILEYALFIFERLKKSTLAFYFLLELRRGFRAI